MQQDFRPNCDPRPIVVALLRDLYSINSKWYESSARATREDEDVIKGDPQQRCDVTAVTQVYQATCASERSARLKGTIGYIDHASAPTLSRLL